MSVKWYGDEIERKIDEATKVALTAVGVEIQGEAKQLLTDYPAVDTGRLRNSIVYKTKTYTSPMGSKTESRDLMKSVPSEGEVLIGTAVYYAPYVEYGTRKMRPRSFLRRALDQKRKEANDIFRKEFKRILND